MVMFSRAVLTVYMVLRAVLTADDRYCFENGADLFNDTEATTVKLHAPTDELSNFIYRVVFILYVVYVLFI